MKATENKDYTITYTEKDGIFYPDLKLPEQTNQPMGKYGLMRLDFFKNHRKGLYTTLLTECRLNEHLHNIDEQAKEAVRTITADLSKSRGINEALKATDGLRWVQEMNNVEATAEEIVFKEIIHI